jgi:hypothetical protein
MYFAKLPILVLILRSFGIKTWLRRTSYILMVVTAMGFLAAALYTGIKCSPGLYEVNVSYLLSCVDATFYTIVSRNCLSLTVDLIIFVLPLPVIRDLHLPRRTKIGVALIFLTGSL